MTSESIKAAITSGQTALGVEFGSTTIKAVLTTQDGTTIASGSYDWTNSFQDGGRTRYLMSGLVCKWRMGN